MAETVFTTPTRILGVANELAESLRGNRFVRFPVSLESHNATGFLHIKITKIDTGSIPAYWNIEGEIHAVSGNIPLIRILGNTNLYGSPQTITVKGTVSVEEDGELSVETPT